MPAPKSGHPAARRAILPGQRFGKLVVLRRSKRRLYERENGKRHSLGALWICNCDCGRQVSVCHSYLNAGMRKRCGLGECRAYTHGLFTGLRRRRNQRTYNSYGAMLDRCTNPNATGYPDYGGRGITVCERWALPLPAGFENFIADMGKRPRGKTLDRINPDGHYEPGNCRWATPKVQANNQRRHWVARPKPMTPEQEKASEEFWKDPLADPTLAAPAF